MPLVNLGLTEGQIRSKSIQNNTFHSFSSNSSFSEILATLTKFDLKLISCRPKNPNFDLIVRTGWNQCHCEDYEILIPMTIHGSKSELERPRYHENRDDAPIDTSQTSKSHNFWFDCWIFRFHTFSELVIQDLARGIHIHTFWGP